MLLQGTYRDYLSLSLSKANSSFIKASLFLAEKMARNLQQVFYLKHLKSQGRFPTTIQNIKLPSFFNCDKMVNSGNFIRSFILNKTIRYVNSQAAISRNQLTVNIVRVFEIFTKSKAISICSIIEKAFQRSNERHKKRLLEKIDFSEEKTMTKTNTNINNIPGMMVTDFTGTLDKDELTLLAKGPKFALTNRINEMEVRASFCQLAYQLRWRAQMASTEHQSDERHPTCLPRYPQSSFISQPQCNNKELEGKLKGCYVKIMELVQQVKERKTHVNISPIEMAALKRLQRKDFIFLPSDKGSEFCVIESSRYDEAALAHLGDASIYKPIARMTAKTIETKLNQTWKSICSQSNIPHSITRTYVTSNSDLPRFYHLIKTHKEGPELRIRPIVSNINGPTFKLSWLLSHLLTSLLERMPTHLKNSHQLLKSIQDIPKGEMKQFSYPFSLDVVSLYTSIPPSEAITALEEHLHACPEIKLPFRSEQIAELLSIILANTYFKYRGKVFQQISGLPMGNSISGLLAMVYMTRLENQIVDNLQIGLYKRYVDDVLILTTTREEADRIFHIMNNINDNIKFEAEYPTTSNSISMLDFCLTIKDGEPQFRFYKKEAKRNMFPHIDSAMPMSIKRNIINNEIRRISERCTVVSDKIMETNKFLNDLTTRGYEKNTHKVKKQKRRKNIDMTNFCYFQFPFVNDATHHSIRRIFASAQLPVRIFNNNHNLRSLLSRQKIQENCNMKNCSLNDGKLCHTKMCVYEMQCENCHESYIGSTTRALHNRVREHLQMENSSVFKHRKKCASTFCVKVIARDNNANRLRFKEAIYIQEKCPKMNNKVEREELLNLIF